MVLGFDAATMLAVVVGLRRRRRAMNEVVLYAWNPLVIVEFAWSAHVDSAAVALATWAVVCGIAERRRAAVAFASIAAGIKVFPALLLPLLIRRAGTRRSWWIPLTVAAIGSAPYLSVGLPAILVALRIYARDWEFNGGLYTALREFVHDPSVVRRALGASVLLVTAIATRRNATTADGSLAILFACIALSPTVHPWYVTWLAPLVALASRPPRLASLLLTLVVPLSYVVLAVKDATGHWFLPEAWMYLEWGTVLAVCAIELGISTVAGSRIRRAAATLS
jgi:hypothetical protein